MKIIAQSDVITLASVYDGIGISSVVPQYYLSTSETETINGIWSYEQPVWSSGHYIWTRSEITNSDNEVTYTTPIVATALNSANKAASDASTKADSAYDTAESASETANTASTTAAEAKTIASTANETSAQANTKAEKAQSDAAQAIKTSNDAKDGVAAVNQDISSLKTTVDGMNTDISTAQQNITKNANAITGINQKLSTDYATKTEVSDTKASLETEISTSASNLAASVKETYASKSDVSTIQGELENKIQVNTDGLSATSKKVTSLESQTSTISQNLTNAAKTAEDAQKNAQAAIASAKTAQDTADTAVSNAKAAGDKATEAQNQLDAAKKKVADADAALKTAKANYDSALSAYNSVSADPNATAVQIETAKEKLTQAQTALSKALADVLTANHDVTDAQTATQDALNNAVTAYQNAEMAMKDAKTAQDTADQAVASAKKANEDLAALTNTVNTQETKITQNSNSITSLANRTTTVENKFTGYYTKSEADSKIKQSSDSITSTVSQTYETKTDSASKLSSAKSYADSKASSAQSGAQSYTDNKLKNYSTTSQMTSAINQKADSITSEVKKVDQRVSDIQIGGRNLWLNSSLSENLNNMYVINGDKYATEFTIEDGFKCLHVVGKATNNAFAFNSNSMPIANKGDVFTLSADFKFKNIAKGPSTNESPLYALYRGGETQNGKWIQPTILKQYNIQSGGAVQVPITGGDQDWKRIGFTFRYDYTPSTKKSNVYLIFRNFTGDVYVKNVKLERGNKPTDWTPAPEDLTSYTDSQIKQTSDSINTKVSKTDYTGSTVTSLINQSADSVKIQAKHLDIAGAVTFSSFDSATQSKINAKADSSSLNNLVTQSVNEYTINTSPTTAPTSGWSTTQPAWADGKYIWMRTKTTTKDGTVSYSNPACITGAKGATGATGAKGATGPQGPKGENGVSPTVSVSKSNGVTTISITDKNGTHTQTVNDGANGTPGAKGADGRTPYFHVKYSNDGGKTFTANSGETAGTYIGTCTDYNSADPTTVSSYTWAKIKGEQGIQGNTGPQGPQGIKGDTGPQGPSGTSVTVKSTSVTYQAGTSPTTAPTGTWGSSVPTVTAGQYLWTKTVVTYSDGKSTTAYSVARQGANGIKGDKGDTGATGPQGPKGASGTSVTVKSTSVTYAVTGSNSQPADSAFTSTTMPAVSVGQYLWNKATTVFSDNKSITSYSVSRIGTDGKTGSTGASGKTTHFAYSTSADGKSNFNTSLFSGATYIGTYDDTTTADSTDPTKYKWTKLKGDTGATGPQGPKGKDGNFWVSNQNIDLTSSSYNVNTWYPVVGNGIPADGTHEFKVASLLNGRSHPSWSTHKNGFSVMFEVEDQAGGWGTTNRKTRILTDDYLWGTGESPVSYTQLVTASYPVFWLRGGGFYPIYSTYNTTWSIKTSTYIAKTESIAPLSHRPAPEGVNILSTLGSKNKVIYSTSDPSSTSGYISGDTWFNKATGGIWQFDGKAWKLHQVGTVSISDGAVTADKIAAGSITAEKLSASSVSLGNLDSSLITSNLLPDSVNNIDCWLPNPGVSGDGTMNDFLMEHTGEDEWFYDCDDHKSTINFLGVGGDLEWIYYKISGLNRNEYIREDSRTYTLSFEFRNMDRPITLLSSKTYIPFGVFGYGIHDQQDIHSVSKDWNTGNLATIQVSPSIDDKRYSVTFSTYYNTIYLAFNFGYIADQFDCYFSFGKFKLEVGSEATPWETQKGLYLDKDEMHINADAITSGTVNAVDILGSHISGGTIVGNTIKGNTIQGNTISGGTITGTTISGTDITGSTIRTQYKNDLGWLGPTKWQKTTLGNDSGLRFDYRSSSSQPDINTSGTHYATLGYDGGKSVTVYAKDVNSSPYVGLVIHSGIIDEYLTDCVRIACTGWGTSCSFSGGHGTHFLVLVDNQFYTVWENSTNNIVVRNRVDNAPSVSSSSGSVTTDNINFSRQPNNWGWLYVTKTNGVNSSITIIG